MTVKLNKYFRVGLISAALLSAAGVASADFVTLKCPPGNAVAGATSSTQSAASNGQTHTFNFLGGGDVAHPGAELFASELQGNALSCHFESSAGGFFVITDNNFNLEKAGQSGWTCSGSVCACSGPNCAAPLNS